MAGGLKIAKPGYNVSASTEHLYVDTDESLLKVYGYGSGAIIFDGVTRKPTFSGTGFTTSVTDDMTGYSVSILVPHRLGYTPLFMVYADINNNSNREYVTNISTVSTGMAISARADARLLEIRALPYILPSQTIPVAGNYGFFYYIFNESMTPPGVYPFGQ